MYRSCNPLRGFFMRRRFPVEPERVFGQKQQVIGRDSSFEIADQTPFLPGIFELYRNGRSLKTPRQGSTPRRMSPFSTFRSERSSIRETETLSLSTAGTGSRFFQRMDINGFGAAASRSGAAKPICPYRRIWERTGAAASTCPNASLLTNADRNGRS